MTTYMAGKIDISLIFQALWQMNGGTSAKMGIALAGLPPACLIAL